MNAPAEPGLTCPACHHRSYGDAAFCRMCGRVMKPQLSPQPQRLVEMLAKGATRADAYRLAGVSRSTFYAWLKNSPEFRQAVKGAEGSFLSAQASVPFPASRPVVDASAARESRSLEAGAGEQAVLSLPGWAAVVVMGIAIVALFSFLFSLPGA